MWDRYDPQDDDRDRGNAWDRSLGGRGSTSHRDRNEERDPRDVFQKDLDLPRGSERQPVRERDRVYEINGTESRMLVFCGSGVPFGICQPTWLTSFGRAQLTRH